MQADKVMHDLWGMSQMMFANYLIVVDADVDMHNTSEVLFRLCANTDPQRDSIFTKGPSKPPLLHRCSAPLSRCWTKPGALPPALSTSS